MQKLVSCMGVEYVPDLYAGFRYDDPMIGIPWPETVAALSAKEAGWPLLADPNFWPGKRGS
jgi:dTDP-4-dehydrorhamnose 3,5-epimerase